MTKAIDFLALFGFSVSLFGQGVITTIAGTQWILNSSGRPGVQTPLGEVYSVASDWNGGAFIADTGNARIFHLDSQGTLSVYAGNGEYGFSGDGGPATNASLGWEVHIASDQAGNLYLNDCYNYRIRKIAPDGSINTIAGNGQSGFSGDGGPALQASLNTWPSSGIAVDGAGNVYIVDEQNNRVRKISTGKITTVAGNGMAGFSGDGGLATSASLSPLGVAVGPDGSLYIATGSDGHIRKVSPAGIISTFAGNGMELSTGDGGPATSASLDIPWDVAVDSGGIVYIADSFGGKIRKVALNGTITTVAGTGAFVSTGDGGSATSAGLGFSPSLAISSDGQIFIATDTIYTGNVTTGLIRKVNPTGIISTVAGNGAFNFAGDGGLATDASLYLPSGAVLDTDGSLYIADSFNFRIRKVSPQGVISTVAGNGDPFGPLGDGASALNASMAPFSVAVDKMHNLYIADRAYNRVRKVDGSGVISTVAGGGASSADGIAATLAALQRPSAIAFDAAANLYIADGYADLIRKVTPAGIISTVAGNGTAGFSGDNGPATLAAINLSSFAFGLTVDQGGNLFFTDSGNNRVRKVNVSGTITTVAGNGQAGYSGNGGLATLAALDQPFAVAVDQSGNLYISDSSTTVRKVSPNGIISLFAGGGLSLGDGGNSTQAEVSYSYGLTTDTLGNVYICDSGNNRIREVIAGAVSYQAMPSSLSFSASAGGTAPGAQTINLTSSIAGLVFGVSGSAPWLSVTPSSGSMPAVIQVSVDPSQLNAGTTSGSITITSPAGTQTIAVTFNVSASIPGKLGVGASTMAFPVTQGASATNAQLGVLNQGGGSLPFSAAASTSTGGNWLTVSPGSGTATPASPVSLTVTANPGSLAAGTYSGNIVVSSPAGNVTVPVTLAVSALQQTILLSQTGLTFTGVAQGGSPLPQSFGILNTGQGSMNWTATATTLSGGSWLAIDQQSGSVATPFTSVSTVNVTANTSGLTTGTYYGQIQVKSAAGNSPQLISVVLNILQAGSSPGAEVQPTGLIFIGEPGSSPGSQNVMISNPQETPITFGAGFLTVPTGGNWAQILPLNATVAPNAPVSMVVQPNYTSLGTGVYQGFVSMGFLDGSSRAVHVLVVVAPGAGTRTAGTGAVIRPDISSSGSCGPLNVQPTTLSASANNLTLGQAVPLQVKVVDNCGNPLTGGSVQATFSNKDAAVNLVSIGGGNWTGNWTPRNSAAQVQINYLALEVTGTTPLSGTGAVTVSLASSSAPVTLGIANAASGAGAYIAPGGLVSIYGQQLAGSSSTSGNAPFPTVVNGTQVLLGGTPLPLRYVGSGQINAQVPFGLGINTEQQLVVINGATLSVPQNVVVAAAQPGVYTQDQSGMGSGVIVDANTNALVAPSSPAHAGDVIVVYCNGLGAVTPAVPTGTAAPLSGPPSQTVNPVTATIGGVNAVVQFAGLAPGYPDLYQVNAVVPAGVVGNSVSLVLTVSGQSSPQVTLAVQ
jgi:trimeric autotransporter adhesin